jgi:hypothetical protein
MRGRATKQLSGVPVTNGGPNGDAVQGFALRREQIGVGESVQPWGLPGTNAWLGRRVVRTIVLQTGNFYGTVPLYLGETDSGVGVQPVYP